MAAQTVTARPDAPVDTDKEITPKYTILFATDGSPIAEDAFQEAVKMARYMKGRLVLTFYAFPEDWTVFGGLPCSGDEEWRACGCEVIEGLATRARAAGVPVVETVLENHQNEKSLFELGIEVGANMTTLASHYFKLS